VIDGAQGVLRTLDADAVICVHTTVALDTIHGLVDRADAHGVIVVDAGISGGETGAHAGTLLTMVGGPAGAVDLARPVLDAFSKLFSIARTMFPEVMRV
jgi:3-hydroxyisobutyrate dehydrogenase